MHFFFTKNEIRDTMLVNKDVKNRNTLCLKPENKHGEIKAHLAQDTVKRYF